MYGKYIVNVPLLQKSVRKIERKCTENAIHWVTVYYKDDFENLESEIYLHVLFEAVAGFKDSKFINPKHKAISYLYQKGCAECLRLFWNYRESASLNDRSKPT